jgi:putative tricarboxylic transport membrane protein
MNFGLLYTEGLNLVFQTDVLMFLFAGVLLGISIGCIPGLTVIMAVAVLTPFTYDLRPLVAILTLIGIYCGGNYGGSISACLVNVPGTPSAIMTTLDGYPLTTKGKAGLAIGTATVSSFLGGLFSVFVLTFLSPVVARFALNFISAEYFALGVLGISLIAYLGKGSSTKGFLSGLLGLFLATIGADPMIGYPRFTFGSSHLITGLEFITVMIGLLGIAEILIQAESLNVLDKVQQTLKGIIPSFMIIRSLAGVIMRSSVVGVIIGAIPGAGGTIASIVAYGQQKRVSRNPEQMGEGSLEGVAAAEGANNACTGGAMLTMLSLGIPGDAVTGVMIGALMIHGLSPGPVLFKENFELVSSIFIGMLLANMLVLVLGLGGAKFFAKMISAPKRFLNTAILSLAVIGSFAVQNSFFDVGVTLLFGVLGYVMVKFDIPRAPLVLGLILGPLIENNLRRSLLLVNGDVSQFLRTLVTRPISASILLIIVLLFFYPILKKFISDKFGKTPENV